MMKLGKNCNGCHACYSICVNQAIEMVTDSEGFLRPFINKNLCINCGSCYKVCPLIGSNVELLFHNSTNIAYAAKAPEYQLTSTSGGFFAALAHQVLLCGGVVYGAGYTKNFCVEHMRITEANELHLLQDSKYVQSRIGESFKNVRQDLQCNRKVLFSGTACQIAGLRSFLRKEYDNLVCVDVICHGVPSPRVWEWYIRKFKDKSGKNIKSIRHRGKHDGGWSWKNQFFQVIYEDDSIFEECIWENPYTLGFLKNVYLRSSCYKCVFKNTDIRRVSDFSIADFWGCENEEPEFFDGNGVSLVLVNSRKGQEIIQSSNWIEIERTEIRRALKYNVAAYRPYEKTCSHWLFWRRFDENLTIGKFTELVQECSRRSDKEEKSVLRKVERKIARILRKSGVLSNNGKQNS